MIIRELLKYDILAEMCSLIWYYTNDKNIEDFYEGYPERNLEWLDKNIEKILIDFIKMYNKGDFIYAFNNKDVHYKELYENIVQKGVLWFL